MQLGGDVDDTHCCESLSCGNVRKSWNVLWWAFIIKVCTSFFSFLFFKPKYFNVDLVGNHTAF